MHYQLISYQRMVADLQPMRNQPIWRVIHPSDGWLIIDVGRRYWDSLPGLRGEETSYQRGEYHLFIKGNWQLSRDTTVLQERAIRPAEDSHHYFERMEQMAERFPIKGFSQISFESERVNFAGDGLTFSVPTSGILDSIGATIATLNESGKPVCFNHYRYEDPPAALVLSTVELPQ